MAERFDYPTYAATTKTLTFSSATGGVDRRLDDPDDGVEFQQAMERTAAGELVVGSTGTPRQTFECTYIFQYSHATYTDWADVLSFFGEDYANGGVNTFQWTDHAGTVRTVRLTSGSLRRRMLSDSLCQVTFTLEEV